MGFFNIYIYFIFVILLIIYFINFIYLYLIGDKLYYKFFEAFDAFRLQLISTIYEFKKKFQNFDGSIRIHKKSITRMIFISNIHKIMIYSLLIKFY